MEPDEHLLNLSEKGRVEIANEVQPQRRAGPGRAGQPGAEGTHNSPGSGTMFEQKVVSQEEERQFYINNDVLNLNFNPRKSGNEFLETQKCKITSKSLKI